MTLIPREDRPELSGLHDIAFDAYLANDRTLDDPEVVRVERGGRVRLRIINGSSATAYWIDLAGLPGTLIAVDGNPVEPVAGSLIDLFGTYAGGTADMKTWLSTAQINTDMNLRLQFLAGRSLNVYQSDPIYKSMIREVEYPENLFAGRPETLAALRQRVTEQLTLSGAGKFPR
jgi:hypothetical protein